MDKNVLGGELESCSHDPLTGFYRTGDCQTGPEDVGRHTVCAVMTADFLAFSQSVGNDLSTPSPQFGFPGLKPGDRWCICLARWIEAYEAGKAPWILLRATHESVRQYVDMDVLTRYGYEARAN